MSVRRVHRIMGLVMLLPFLGWAATGAIFFIKPGYAGAYEALSVKTYPIERPIAIAGTEGWLELRYLRTVLGDHVLARSAQGWQHLGAAGAGPRPAPSPDEVRGLLEDAFTRNPSRYGHVLTIDGTTATTDTGVRVTLDWSRLTLSQRGRDTDRIDWFYKIHYLQWTGVAGLDRALGAIGLSLIVTLSALGVWIYFRRVHIEPVSRN